MNTAQVKKALCPPQNKIIEQTRCAYLLIKKQEKRN